MARLAVAALQVGLLANAREFAAKDLPPLAETANTSNSAGCRRCLQKPPTLMRQPSSGSMPTAKWAGAFREARSPINRSR